MRTGPTLLLIALSLCGAQQACRRSADEEHLATAVRLRATADSLQRAVDAVDTTAFAGLRDLFEADRAAIEQRFQDTLGTATAALLGNYHRTMSAALPHALEDRAALSLHLDSTRHRLGALEHDVQHALLDGPEEIIALERERAHLARLLDLWTGIEARLAAVRAGHERARPAVDSLLNPAVTTP